jgi:hypothetical protein
MKNKIIRNALFTSLLFGSFGCSDKDSLAQSAELLRASGVIIDKTVPASTTPTYECIDWGQITYKNTVKDLAEKYCRKCHAGVVNSDDLTADDGENPNKSGYAIAPKYPNLDSYDNVKWRMAQVFSETLPMPPPQSEEPIEEADLERLRIWYYGEEDNEEKPPGLEIPEVNISDVAHSNSQFRITYSADADDESESPSVAIFYDTDREGFDGTLLQECMSLSEPGISTSIDSSDVSNGTYYLYACVFDGDNVTCDYADDSVSVGPVRIAGSGIRSP